MQYEIGTVSIILTINDDLKSPFPPRRADAEILYYRKQEINALHFAFIQSKKKWRIAILVASGFVKAHPFPGWSFIDKCFKHETIIVLDSLEDCTPVIRITVSSQIESRETPVSKR